MFGIVRRFLILSLRLSASFQRMNTNSSSLKQGQRWGWSHIWGSADPAAHSISPDEVILFSGGLDSLAGVVDELIGHKKKVILVSQQSSNMVASKQNALIAAVRGRSWTQ